MQDQFHIQSTQYIINLFESSKEHSEEALETLPGIYTIIDSQGSILKGNKNLATLFQVDHEDLLDKKLSALLAPEQWQIFLTNLQQLEKPDQKNIEFKMDLVCLDKSILNYLWEIKKIPLNRGNELAIYSIVGRDVTALTQSLEQGTRMQMELNTAKLVQEMYFPPLTASFQQANIAGYFESASECGGDWWHYYQQKDKLFIWMGDVTGHGVAAALVVSAVHAVSHQIDEDMEPSQILSILNKAVSMSAKGQRAMTFLVCSIDLKTYECAFSSAAHEPGLVLPGEKEKIEMRDLKLLKVDASSPLGVEKEYPYKDYSMQLKKGDRLFLYTDGIYDISNPQGEAWERSGFRRILADLASKNKNPQEFAQAFKKNIADYRQGTALPDDVTFCLIDL